MKNEKGMVLFIVLGTIMVIIILANIILGVVSSQSRLTHHQISRIQAFYAAQAGVNYAREMIRLNNPASGWIPNPDVAATAPVQGRLCRTQGDCLNFAAPRDIVEGTLPSTVKSVTFTIGGLGSGISGTREIKATVDYAPPA